MIKIESVSRLPSGYQEVEYIKSSGTQYIDTGYTVNAANTISWEFTATIAAQSTAYMGANGYMQFCVNTSGVGVSSTNSSGLGSKKTFRIDFSNSVANLYINSTLVETKNWSGSYSGTNVKLGVFKLGDANNAWNTTTSAVSCTLYEYVVYVNGTKSSHCIPCYRTTDNVAGMYDIVQNVFRTNAGSGSFAVGANTDAGTAVTVTAGGVIPEKYALRRRFSSRDGASLGPASGITYTNGLAGLTAAEISTIAALISNEPTITEDTQIVYVDLGDLHRKLAVTNQTGNQATISLNGTNYTFDILGFNHDQLTTATAYGRATATGKAGMTLQMNGIFSTLYKLDPVTGNGRWKDSEMRNSTMPIMKGYMPSAWQSVIKPVNKASSLGGGSTSGTETVSDSCFLLAEIEIFGSITYSVSGEGTQYAYYKAGNSKVKNKSGSAYYWWERSSRSTYTHGCVVGYSGEPTYSSLYTEGGVSFAFCV